MVSSSPPAGTFTSALLKLALAPGGRVRAGGAIVKLIYSWAWIGGTGWLSSVGLMTRPLTWSSSLPLASACRS